MHFTAPQCSAVLFLSINWRKGHESEPETTYELGTEFKTVLAMGFKVNHFAVIGRINLLEREVMVWDAVPRQSHKIVSKWMEHVVMAIRMHRPKEVLKNAHNVFYPSKKNLQEREKYSPFLWKVRGFMGDYVQDDDYSCPALAINRFAEELRNLSNGTVLGDGIDEFLKFQKTSDENIENAKSLFIRLLETQFDCFQLMDDLGHNWEKQREESDESDNEPPPAEKFHIDKNNQRKEEVDENNQLLPEGSNEINPVVEESKRESNPMDNGETVETNQVADQATEGCQDDSRQLGKRSERNDKTATKPPKKKKECPPSEDKSVAETKCNSGEMCLLPEKKLWLEGGECNGSRCTKCRGPFHHECLFQHDGELYCSKCFKQNVVSQCSTETLFKSLFHNDDWPTSTESMPTHCSKELRLYIDNFLKDNISDMNLQEYEKWKTKAEDYEKETRNNMHRLKRTTKIGEKSNNTFESIHNSQL